MSARVVTVVQARMGSTRLPGKILRTVFGRTLLERQLERMNQARHVGEIVVAIPTGARDDTLADLCEDIGVDCFRGDENDLLDRHVQAARAYAAEVVVKIPSDCPLIDPAIIDRVLAVALDDPARFDYVSNLHPATWPDGNDVEVMRMDALETAWREANRALEREHTTPFLWERPDRFRLENVVWESGRDLSMSHRFTTDYEEDIAFVDAVFERLYPRDPQFGLDAILRLLDEEPALGEINARYAGVNWYRHHLDELSTVDETMTRRAATDGPATGDRDHADA